MMFPAKIGFIHDVASKELPLLQRLAAHGIKSSYHRRALTNLRDRLYDGIIALGEGPHDDYFCEHEQALIDALAFVNSALKPGNDPQKCLLYAADRIGSIDDVLAARN